ncbi:hypothetical protein ACFL3C_03640 [Patescibacteria group bacterium]
MKYVGCLTIRHTLNWECGKYAKKGWVSRMTSLILAKLSPLIALPLLALAAAVLTGLFSWSLYKVIPSKEKQDMVTMVIGFVLAAGVLLITHFFISPFHF